MEFIKISPRLEEAAPLVAKGFMRPISPAIIDDTRQHLHAGDFTYSIFDKSKLIGFTVFRALPKNILFVEGIMIDIDRQGQNIAGDVIRLAQQENKSKFLALRTQSPLMWLAARKLCRTWHPHPDNGFSPPLSINDIGIVIKQTLGEKFCYPKISGCYGGPLYGKKPLCRDARVQTWWDQICDFDQGDAVLCIGEFI